MVGSSKRSTKGNAALIYYNPNVQSMINRFFRPPQEASHQQDQVQVDQSFAIPMDTTFSPLQDFHHPIPNEPATGNEHMQVDQTMSMPFVLPIYDHTVNKNVASSSTDHEQMMEVVPSSSASASLLGRRSITPLGSGQMLVDDFVPKDTVTPSASTADGQLNSGCVLPKKRRASSISSSVYIGQHEQFAKVCGYLRDDDIGMIGIYGMGGIGKTTLMKRVCYEFLKPSHFMVIWATVSKKVDVHSIQRSIMRELNLRCYEDQDLQTRAIKINEALFNHKDKLVALLLDDIWDAIDLEVLGVVGGIGLDPSTIKIIFTTRSKDVCLQMDPDQEMKMECLGWEESWTLFKQSAGEKFLNSHDQILGLVKEVAKECAGLPLALTVVGKAMVCKTSLGAWEDALKNLKNCPSLVSGSDKNLFGRLKFSYENLENQVERECFLFCCMYPEDKSMKRERLVASWIGEGILDESYGTYQEICNRGHAIIDTLLAKSLLEFKELRPTMYVKVHDVMRDMGLWICSEMNIFVHTNSLKLRAEETTKRWNNARRVYVENHNHDLPAELDCPNLSTLHFGGIYSKLDIKISTHFLKSLNFMHRLKVLIINFVELECPEIPPSTLGLLVELRYLEIKNSNMRALPPDIGNLTKLVVLKLMNNNVPTTLPTSIGHLCELRKLQIQSSFITTIPLELGKLKKVEIVEIDAINNVILFSIFNHFIELRRLDLAVNNLTMLPKDLPRWNKLDELRIAICEKQDAPQGTPLLRGLKELTSLKLLQMDGWPIAHEDEVILALETMHQLQDLHIERCPTNKFVVSSTENDFLPQLKVLHLTGCRHLERVQFCKRALQSLSILKIGGCNSMKTIVGLQHLQQLRKLYIYDSGDALEEGLVTTSDEHCMLLDQMCVCFSHLQRLVLSGMRKMKRICSDNVSFPCLVEFGLFNCDMLEKLPRGLMNKNRTLSGDIVGTEEWWEGLEWKDERLEWKDDEFKSYLRPLFKNNKKV